MEKLLHERLRECSFDMGACTIELVYGGDRPVDYCYTHNCVECEIELAQNLADEIERYYIPRPRFEDGEPVQFGDEIEWADCNIRAITGFGITPSGKPYVTCAFDGKGVCDAMVYSGSIRRPAKVLDADGEPIEVGDTVYEVNTGHESTVTSTTMISSDGCNICCKDGGAGVLHYNPEDLTHREPDSLEKLRDDMVEFKDSTYCSFLEVERPFERFIDRLDALLERDA